MKDSEEKENYNKKNCLICSICNKKNLDIKLKNTKIKKLINDNFNKLELTELIKKCKCNNNIKSNNIYAHRYCILLKIIFNFEIKCGKCNTLYNIKIDKKIDKIKKIIICVTFLIIYIVHLSIYIFSIFLLFIKVILKENIIIIYKHLYIFFGIIILIINSIFLYFSIINNIQKTKYYIYKYSINIFDILTSNGNNCLINNESEFYKLILEFYQWFYNQSVKNLLTNINKKNIFNKEQLSYNNSFQEYINKNNIEINISDNNQNNKNIDVKKQENKSEKNDNNDNSKNIIIINNDNDNNDNNDNDNDIDINKNNILNINKKNIQQENEIFSNKTKNSKEDIKSNKLESNNNSLNHYFIKRLSSNNFESLNTIQENLKLKPKEFINININPRDSKNININIHFTNDKFSQNDFSSSKEINYQFNKRKIGKTALIPKNLIMSNIISEANSIKRKSRQLKSIKIRNSKFKLQSSNQSREGIVEDEEIDFSEFDKMGTKISKDKKTLVKSKNDYSELKYSNFRSKKSYKEIDLNISNSDFGGIEGTSVEQNNRMSLKNSGKHVHFAD